MIGDRSRYGIPKLQNFKDVCIVEGKFATEMVAGRPCYFHV